MLGMNRRNKLFVVVVISTALVFMVLIHELIERDGALSKLESLMVQAQMSNGRRRLSETGSVENSYFNNNDMIIIYNRVPKTGSTSFAGIAYELCGRNKFHVLHVNLTRNMHTMNVQDQMNFIQNITEWEEKKPAMYHGHFYYIDFSRLGYNLQRPIYINVLRKPLDRLLSYYYFIRYGDNFRPLLRRRKQGDEMTFDECVQMDHKDCDPVNLWVQIPFFCGHSYRCRQPGSRWALEQAKFNLVNNYLLVGVTEELQDFIAMLEVMLPRFFTGASDMYQHSNKSHLRQTIKKEMPSEESLLKIQKSTIWKLEHEFYDFAVEQFHFLKKLTFKALVDLDIETMKQKLEVENLRTYLLSDGKFYIAKTKQFHYEKVRPR